MTSLVELVDVEKTLNEYYGISCLIIHSPYAGSFVLFLFSYTDYD
jgi:hypothetical protein